jgi:hypothetical protein
VPADGAGVAGAGADEPGPEPLGGVDDGGVAPGADESDVDAPGVETSPPDGAVSLAPLEAEASPWVVGVDASVAAGALSSACSASTTCAPVPVAGAPPGAVSSLVVAGGCVAAFAALLRSGPAPAEPVVPCVTGATAATFAPESRSASTLR